MCTFKVKFVVFLFTLGILGCSSNNSSKYSDTLDRDSILVIKNLTKGLWVCDQQLSNLYRSQGIQETTYLLFLAENTGPNQVQIYEGSLTSRGCNTNGIFSYDKKEKAIKIRQLKNPNCPWFDNLNQDYVLDSSNKNTKLSSFGSTISIKFRHE